MKRGIIFFTVLIFNCVYLFAAEISFENQWFKMAFSDKGVLTNMYDKTKAIEYLPKGQQTALLSIRCSGNIENPKSMKKSGNTITLDFPQNKVTIKIVASIKNNYFTFELTEITNKESVELVIWGPFPTTISETVGECVGVVRNKDFAIGIQALNVKTLGGYPSEESDIEPSFDIFATGNYVDIDHEWRNKKNYRGQTARVQDFGSVVQAYTRDRSKKRIIPNWNHAYYTAPPFSDGGVIGSKIALFGCPESKTLELIGHIEVAESLPHPIIDGEWSKTARSATASYLIISFGEETLDDALALTKKAGLKYLYHGDPFTSWGHFPLRERAFPDNWVSMKRCVDRANAQGIKLGVHTLSNFINTNDAYVTPVPDSRLAMVGESVISANVDIASDEIFIESPVFFNQMENNTLRAVVIGNEIIGYKEVSASAPWKLTGCVRGAFNTVATAHKKGAAIVKLMDHGYKVFLSKPELSDEIAKTIARLFNETGLMQISFDGLEGVWSTGMGQYARSMFTKTWYDNLAPELKGKVINDASNPSHYNWHINTRYNWGEPWYAGFRESQTYLRLMNQDFYRRNYIPSMLGWFSMSATTSIEDAEWLLARAAGFDAGFAFNVSMNHVHNNGASEAIFHAMKNWETARMAGAFTAEQKLRMEDINNEFHLEPSGDGLWQLYPYKIVRQVHEQRMRQPGEPVQTTFEFDNPYESQPMSFIISLAPGEGSKEAALQSITLEVNNHSSMTMPVEMTSQQHLKLGADGTIQLFDARWKLIKSISPEGKIPVLSIGKNTVSLGAEFTDEGNAMLKIELKTVGKAEPVIATKIEK